MAAKRLYGEDDQKDSQDQHGGKRLKKLPSFSTVIRDVIMAKSLQNFCRALEPLLRQVVKEEMERKLLVHGALMFQRSPQRQIQEEFSNLKLIFKKPPSLPIFTFSKIEDEGGNHLQIQLIDTLTGETPVAFRQLSNLKVEIVVIDGDFPGDKEEWMPTEFNNNITREREGKRPLLLGDVSVTLRDGVTYLTNLYFTDNSSWIRSRHLRIGARVVPHDKYDGPRIVEALTERFTVKDQRGELYKKHYPPALGDEVWRLERIGKGGAFHLKLCSEHIETVQDFLKLLVIDPDHLRTILSSMSDKMWEGTINHARTCPLGTKRYSFNDPYGNTIFLNPIGEVLGANFHGNLYTLDQLPIQQKMYVQSLAKQACYNWDKLEETDCSFPANSLLPIELPAPQGLMASSSSSWHTANQEITTVTEFQIEGPDEETQLFEAAFSLDFFGSKIQPD